MVVAGALLASCDMLPAVAPVDSQLIRNEDQNWDGYLVKVTHK